MQEIFTAKHIVLEAGVNKLYVEDIQDVTLEDINNEEFSYYASKVWEPTKGDSNNNPGSVGVYSVNIRDAKSTKVLLMVLLNPTKRVAGLLNKDEISFDEYVAPTRL